MGLFEEFRDGGWNTYYPDRATRPQLDVTTAIVTYLAVVLAAAVIMVVVGTRGHEVLQYRSVSFVWPWWCSGWGVGLLTVCRLPQHVVNLVGLTMIT